MPFWIKGLILLGVVVALFGLKNSYDEGRRDEGRAEIQALWDVDKAARIKAFAEMTTQWITAKTDLERLAKEREDERNIRLNKAQERARRLPAAVANVRIPGSAIRVLNDAVGDSATAPPAAGEVPHAAAGPAQDPDATVAALVDWGLKCIAAYDQARQYVTDVVGFYEALRAAQGQPEEGQ